MFKRMLPLIAATLLLAQLLTACATDPEPAPEPLPTIPSQATLPPDAVENTESDLEVSFVVVGNVQVLSRTFGAMLYVMPKPETESALVQYGEPEGATVTMEGSPNTLQYGENLIRLVARAEDGREHTTSLILVRPTAAEDLEAYRLYKESLGSYQNIAYIGTALLPQSVTAKERTYLARAHFGDRVAESRFVMVLEGDEWKVDSFTLPN